MTPCRVLIFTALMFVFLLLPSCEERGYWGRQVNTCDPTKSPQIRNAKLWSSTFGKEGAPGCLRVSWGTTLDESLGVYVIVDKNGKMSGYNSKSLSFDTNIEYNLPLRAQSYERHFALFFFGAGITGEKQERHCLNVMGKNNFKCTPDENAECWFSMTFIPVPESEGLQAKSQDRKCVLQLPSGSTNNETTSESESFVSLEGSDGGEPFLPEPSEYFGVDSVSGGESVSERVERPDEKPQESVEMGQETAVEKVREQPVEGGVPSQPWIRRAGGTGNDFGNAIAVDASGNVAVLGRFVKTADFGQFTLKATGGTNIFIAKLDSQGNWLWAKRAGGVGGENSGRAVAFDASGNVFITGRFDSNGDFGKFTLKANGTNDVFIAKLDGNGNWQWAKRVGSTDKDHAHGMAIDAKGEILIIGAFFRECTFGSKTIKGRGDQEIFVAKLDTNGNWRWITSAGGQGADIGDAITIDSKGDILVTGSFQSRAYFGSIGMLAAGRNDVFVAKLSSSGTWLWAKAFGGKEDDIGAGITVDVSNNVYVAGSFRVQAFFDRLPLTSKGSYDAFVLKLDSKGQRIWVKQFGSSNGDYAKSILLDAKGQLFVTGIYQSRVTFGTVTHTAKGAEDIYLVSFDDKGQWLSVKVMGGRGSDEGVALSRNARGDILMTGNYQQQATFDHNTLASKGEQDLFVWKIK